MIATDTAKTVVLILLGLAVLWIIVIIIKNDMQTIIRALIVAALLGLGLYYLDHTKLEKLSFTAIKNDLFPVEQRAYTFQKTESQAAGGGMLTTYVFQEPGPLLSLALMEGGRYMAIRDLRTVNAVLENLDLPPVNRGVPELASITRNTLDADKYRWDDYRLGVLTIERGICRDMSTAQTFPCIARITIRSY
ncbi:MAG TPA: hypothetical protein VLJ16_07365 [Acidobacteriota bacterium]|nr:hypothetical protein [Acidobacteriota bacterium]